MDTKEVDKQEKKITKVREYRAPFPGDVSDILGAGSIILPDMSWLSYGDGELVETDLQGKQLQLPKKETLPKIKTYGGLGFHTVTKDGDFVFTNKDNTIIMRVTPDNRITLFIDKREVKPLVLPLGLISPPRQHDITSYRSSATLREQRRRGSASRRF
uniref:Uncharacterized protein n=1 Tax=Magallana gigas TaxID=29159 RepID=K1QMW6_MAGGI